MRCYKCNEILPDDSVFCPFCGATLSENNVGSTNSERQKITEKQRYYDPDFGFSENNPLVVSSAHMVGCYLKALRTQNGKPFTWEYEEIGNADGVIKYRLFLDGEPYKDIFFNPNGTDSDYLPEGLILDSVALTAAKKGVSTEQYIEDLDAKNKKEREEMEAAEAKRKKKRKTIKRAIIISSIVLFVVGIALAGYLNRNLISYTIAVSNYEKGNYDDAIDRFRALGDYKDSESRIMDCYYEKALSLIEKGDYDEALLLLEKSGEHPGVEDAINECYYQNASLHISNGEYNEAYEELKRIGEKEYKDSFMLINRCLLAFANECFNSENYNEGYSYLIQLKTGSNWTIKDIEPSEYESVIIPYIDYYLSRENDSGTSKAETLFKYIDNNSENYMRMKSVIEASREKIKKSEYERANSFFETGAFLRAIDIYDDIIDYSDAKSKRLEAVYCYVCKKVTDYKDYLENGLTTTGSEIMDDYNSWKIVRGWDSFVNQDNGFEYAKELKKEKYKDGEELYLFVLNHCNDYKGGD